ncbi:MAG: ParB N-terminal domain-containing protein [Haloechinothrix sp.]
MTTSASAEVPIETLALARRLATSEQLRRRRFELLPLAGPAAPFAEVQGRQAGDSTTPSGLADLISSIATVGVLQPVLVEELPRDELRLVSGERRLRAASWGAIHLGDNPHFASIPAVICPGPLSEEERRVWQLVENLAREDLRPGELAAALLYERCAVLTAKLLAAGIPVPEDVARLDDPVERFRALDRLRLQRGASRLGAPWLEVLRRLGIQMSEERAKHLVRAFAALPQELSAEMDAAGVALATRMKFLRLDRGRSAAASELWEAVKARGRPDLLAAAVRESFEHPGVGAGEALGAAETLHREANEARARSQRVEAREALPSAEGVDAALEALKVLVEQLRDGARVGRYEAGSLHLYAEELLELLAQRAEEAVA